MPPHIAERSTQRKSYCLVSRSDPADAGVIEAGCRTIVGQRLKQAGMFWSVRGAHAILQARCCILCARFDTFWDDRAVA